MFIPLDGEARERVVRHKTIIIVSAIAANVSRKHAVVFAAPKRCGGSRYQKPILLRLEPQTNTRQKQWSDHN